MILDGVEIENKKIFLEDNGKFHNIEIFMWLMKYFWNKFEKKLVLLN